MTIAIFTPTERKDCGLFMGQSKFYGNQESTFQNALDNVNALINDPNDQGATITEVRFQLGELNNMKAQLTANRYMYNGTEVVDEMKYDAIRTTIMLRFIDGPAACQALAILLNFQPTDPYFSPAKSNGRVGKLRGTPIKGY